MNQALNLDVYSVSGNDATRFLQGQLTQDMSQTDKHWHYAAHCNPKGRVISIFQTFCLQKTHYLIVPSELAEESIAQIKKYIMRSDVVVKKTDYAVFFSKNTSSIEHSFHQEQQNITLSLPNVGSMQLIPASDHHDNNYLSQADWDTARIQLGVPRVHPETIGKFTPEAINLDLSGAISFTKGCYTGQEIVARMHYLGNAKQRLFQLNAPSNNTIQPNAVITNQHHDKVGTVVDTDNQGNLLGSLKVEHATQPLLIDSIEITIVPEKE